MNRNIKVTCELKNKLKFHYNLARKAEDKYYMELSKIEEEAKKVTGIDIEIFRCDGEIVGIGNYDRTMRLIHGVELEK